LSLNDLKKTTDSIPLKKENINNTTVFIFPQPTNQVTYFRSLLNTSHLTKDLKNLIPLFCNVVTRMGTKSMDFRQFDQLVRKSTGGLQVSQSIIDSPQDMFNMKEAVILNSHCLDKNVYEMFELWKQLFTQVIFKDKNRFKTLVQEEASSLANSISGSGHMYAMLCATAGINPIDAKRESYGGLQYVSFIKKIAQMEDLSPILKKLENISEQLLNKNTMKCSLTIVDDNSEAISSLQSFLDSISGNWNLSNEYNKVEKQDNKNNCIHHVLPFSVNYCAKALPGVHYVHKDFAPLKVLCKYLSSKYLLPTVREKNGAYGSGASLSTSGSIQMYSYRDPKPLETFQAFDQALDWVNKKKISLDELNEAKLAIFQGIDHPVAPMSKGNALFFYDLNEQIRQEHRNQIMKVNIDDILNVANIYFSNTHFSKVLIGPANNLNNSETSWNVTNHEDL